MTVLDTHIWIWWAQASHLLPPPIAGYLEVNEKHGLGVSAVSCWELAKLVELNRVVLPLPVGEWIDQALAYPNLQLLPLTPAIAVASTQLPKPFHRDPFDQIIVATARHLGWTLVTRDREIMAYPHVDQFNG